MSDHAEIANELQCPRLWVDRSLVIFNLVAAMDYFPPEQRYLLFCKLVKTFDQNPPPFNTINILFEQAPLETWQNIEAAIYKPIILGLGNDSVSGYIPAYLTELTGDQAAEPDPEEIERVQEEMWKEEDIPKNVVPLVSTEDNITKTTTQKPYSAPYKKWGLIIACYDPEREQFQYHHLPSGQVISSTLIETKIHWNQFPIVGWPFSKEEKSFSVPHCQEEEIILSDFKRRFEDSDLYFLRFSFCDPSPSMEEKLVGEQYFQIRKELRHYRFGLNTEIHCHLDAMQKGGVSLQLPQTAQQFSFQKQTVRSSWQLASQWSIEIEQISGTATELPLRWQLDSTIEQRLQATGGQAGKLQLRNAFLHQINDEFGLHFPKRPFLNSDSHHMTLLASEYPEIDCKNHSTIIEEKRTPTLRRTPNIDKKAFVNTKKSGQGMRLSSLFFVEQSTKASQLDANLDGHIQAQNSIFLHSNLEIAWGAENNGFQLHFPSMNPLSFASEKNIEKEEIDNMSLERQQIVLQQAIGHLSFVNNGEKQNFIITQQGLRERTRATKQEKGSFQIETSWKEHIHNTPTEELPFEHQIILNHDTAHFLLTKAKK